MPRTGGGLKDTGSYLTGDYEDYLVVPDPVTWNPATYYSYTPDAAQSVKSIVMANAGVGKAGLPSTNPTPTPTPTAQPTVSSASRGDVNNDGQITIVDALMTAQYIVGLNPPGFLIPPADANCDGTINIIDALMIAQYYIGLIPGFPCGSLS